MSTGSDDTEVPALDNPRLLHARRLFLTVMTARCLLMVPWIGYLAAALPDLHPARNWKLAWVGFDVLLVLGLVMTAWPTWRRRQMVVPFALAGATLLICDGWFDVSLDWGTSDGLVSLLTALLIELPMAAYLAYTALRIIRIMMTTALTLTGYVGPIPPLRKVSIAAVDELTHHAGALRGTVKEAA
jgi:hypothetical protein